MEILGLIVLGVLGVVAAILLAASTRADHFRTARTLRIAATPERLFPLINDLRQMNTWNPFALRETEGTAIYGGTASGPGQAYKFVGPKSGAGSIEIVEATPPSSVVMRLKMTKPFKADNRVEFTLVPAAAMSGAVGTQAGSTSTGTAVTWAMTGRQPLLAKAVGLFIDCDKMVGRDFEAGLANLKAKAEDNGQG